MITMFDVALVKEQSGEDMLIHFSIYGRDFLFRRISLSEYMQCKNLSSTIEDFNDYICQVSLMHCSEGEFEFASSPLAAISDICAPYIIEKSSINDMNKVLQKLELERENNARFLQQCALLVKTAFPEFPIDEITNWHYDKLMKHVAQAEFILTLKLNREIKMEFEVKENATDIAHYTDEELMQQGVDLLLYYGKDEQLISDVVEYPIIIGYEWDNDEVIHGVRRQIFKRRGN